MCAGKRKLKRGDPRIEGSSCKRAGRPLAGRFFGLEMFLSRKEGVDLGGRWEPKIPARLASTPSQSL